MEIDYWIKNHTMWYKAQTVAQHYPHYKQNSHTVNLANKSIPMEVRLEWWPQLVNPYTITTPIISNVFFSLFFLFVVCACCREGGILICFILWNFPLRTVNHGSLRNFGRELWLAIPYENFPLGTINHGSHRIFLIGNYDMLFLMKIFLWEP